MIKKELKKIMGNKLLFATVIVAMCLPVLYAGIFLKSIWDPYGRISHLPVAVVNLDQPTSLEGKKVDVGNQLVSELKKNDDLDWHFVSSEKAKTGLKDRKYYMIVKIPKTFSKNAASVLDTDPEKMDLTYETNGGLNFLGEVISENAMTQLKAKVSEQVTKSYADVIISMVKTVGTGMNQAADGANQLADGSSQVANGLATVKDKVPALTSGVSQLADGSSQLASGVQQYTDGVGTAGGGSAQLANGLQALNGKVPALVGGINRLADGSKVLANGVNQYTDGVHQAYVGSSQLADGLKVLSYKVPGLSDGVNQLVDGGNQFVTGLNAYTNGVAQAGNGSGQLTNGLQTLQSQLPELAKGINQLADGSKLLADQLKAGTDAFDETKAAQLQQYVNGVQRYISSINQVLPALSNLPVAQLGQLQAQMATVANNLQNVGANLEGAYQVLSASPQQVATNVLAQLPNENGMVTVSAENLTTLIEQAVGTSNAQAMQQLGSATQNLQAVGGQLTQLSQVVSALPTIDPTKFSELNAATPQLAAATDQATAGLTSLINGTLNVKEKAVPGAAQIASGLTKVQEQLPALSNGIGQLVDGSKALDSGLATLNGKTSELTGGATKIVGGMKQMQAQLPTLTDGINQLAAGGNKLNNGLNVLNSKSTDLGSGAGKIAGGLGQMQAQMPALASGASQLADGSKQLNDGMQKLNANSAKLNSGASQLRDGLATLNGQIPTLADGVNKLADGSNKVKDGNVQLANKLDEAAKRIQAVHLSDKTADMIASPDKTTHEQYSEVPNYGHALAPYFMSVSLYVGCLVFNFVYPIRKIADRKNSNATQWFMSKLTVGFIVSTMMALIIGTIMRMIGLTVEQPFNFYATLFITAWLFMFMIMFLAMTFDNPGRFIAVLLLVFQLGSAGGVFPMPLTSHFYNVLNPFMPMTYSIYALRQAISTGLGEALYRHSMLILFILAVVFIMLLGLAMQYLYRKGLAGYSQLHENQKLLDDDYNGKYAEEESSYTLW